jgi:hypothetical protein
LCNYFPIVINIFAVLKNNCTSYEVMVYLEIAGDGVALKVGEWQWYG